MKICDEHLEWNVYLFSCRFHSLCRLPDLHPPQEGHLKWCQRSEEGALWLLFRAGVDLRPSPPHQRLLVRAPAQEAVRGVQPPRLTAVPAWETENEWTNEWMNGSESLILRFTSRPSQMCKSQRTDAGHSATAVVFLSVRLYCFVITPPDQEWNEVLPAQAFTGLMSDTDRVLVPQQYNASLHSGSALCIAVPRLLRCPDGALVQQGVLLTSCSYSSSIVCIVNSCFLCFMPILFAGEKYSL